MAKFFKVFLVITLIFITIPTQVFASTNKKDKLVIGITQFPATLNPIIDSMMAKSYVLGFLQRPITVYNHNWQAECMLCTELPSFENGRAKIIEKSDGNKIVTAKYTLKKIAKWADGTPITTKDILFTWQVGKHPNTGASNFDLFAKDIKNIIVEDDYNFIIEFDEVKCDFASIDDFRLIPAHLEKKVFDEDPTTYKDRTLYDASPTTAGLYFGPYILKHVETGASYTMVKNPNWWGKAPQFEKIVLKVIENTAALGTNLLSGDVDYIAGELGLMVDEALALEKRLKRMRKNKFDVIYKAGLIYEHIDMNFDDPKLKDVRVRKALLHAINRNSLSDNLFGGKQPVAHSNIHPLDSVYDGSIFKYEYSPKVSKQLLSDAGWESKEDGYLYNQQGERFKFSLMTTAGNRTRELVQQAIQSDWSKVGVDVSINNEPARVLFGETIRERKFGEGTMYAWLSSPKNIPRTTLHSTMIPTPENNYAGQNYPGFKSDKVDKILDDLEVVCEPEKNKKLWFELQDIYATDLPALPLYYRANSFIIPKWLKNIRPTGHQYPTSLWVEEWRAE